MRDTETDVPVIVYFHGGGWVQGNVVSYDPLCTHLARQVRAVVVSVDYRKAPEHKAPTAAYDGVDATRWVAAHGGALRADSSRLAVCGDSAGGNLAAVVAQAARDDGSPRISHQVLIYPAVDMTLASPSIDEHANAPILTRANIHAFRAHYLPERADATSPVLSPIFGDLTGLPPALIQTADLDPLRDDGVRYAEALRAAGARPADELRSRAARLPSFPGAVPMGAAPRRARQRNAQAPLPRRGRRPDRLRLVCEQQQRSRPLRSTMREIVVFSGSAHRELAKHICAELAVELSPVEIKRFSNDCLQAQLLANCRQRDVYIVQPLVPPTQEHLMELLLMIDAARGASAAQITAVIPHYAYARSDKKDASRISSVAVWWRTCSSPRVSTECSR